jgi:DNA-binding FrmR family transcriptional regulator
MGKGGKYKIRSIIDEKQNQQSGSEASPSVNNAEQLKMWTMNEKDFQFLMKSIDTLSSKYNEINSKVSEVIQFQEKLTQSMDDLSKRVSTLEESAEKKVENGENCDDVHAQIAEVVKECNVLNEAITNDRIIIRNLPIETHKNEKMINSVVKKILRTLNSDILDTQFESFSVHRREEKSANIVVKFSSAMLKTQVVRKYRAVRKELSTTESPFKVENLVDLPLNHPLRGKTVTITNKLSRKNTELIHHARKFVGSHFDFVFDSPEGSIIIKNKDKFHHVQHEEDITALIQSIQEEKFAEDIHQIAEMFKNSKLFQPYSLEN